MGSTSRGFFESRALPKYCQRYLDTVDPRVHDAPVAIDEKTVRKVARLARIELTDEEIKTYGAQLASILGYVEQLNRLDLDGVEPLAHAGDFDTPLRDDAPAPSLPREAALQNAPSSDPASFIVPRVIEEP